MLFRSPQRSAEAVVTLNGSDWFKTGDNVRQDTDGYLFYVGRTDDIISSAGYRIGPQEVENALITHPAVQESAVVGLPDPERGEIVKAFVVLTQPDSQRADTELVAELQNQRTPRSPAPSPAPPPTGCRAKAAAKGTAAAAVVPSVATPGRHLLARRLCPGRGEARCSAPRTRG